MIQELKSIKNVDESVHHIRLEFSKVSNHVKSFYPIDCLLSTENNTGKIEISHCANAEIRAFNLCFEDLLRTLLKNKKTDLSNSKVKEFFPYLSFVSDSASKVEGLQEVRS
jgi:hypothetical protein